MEKILLNVEEYCNSSHVMVEHGMRSRVKYESMSEQYYNNLFFQVSDVLFHRTIMFNSQMRPPFI